MSLTTGSARQAVRSQVRDGQSSDATPVPYRLARLEDLTDQVAAQATPTAKQFVVRFESVPTQGLVTVYALQGTLVAYVDGSSVATHPSVDVDINGGFTLPVAPVTSLKVTYGYQHLLDSDVDGYVDRARAWLQYADIASVPDGLTAALVKYASALALQALADQCALADSRAGEAQISFSQIAKAYSAQASALEKEANADRLAFSQKPERLNPVASTGALTIDKYQPER